MDIDLGRFGLRSTYAFKESHIPVLHDREVVHDTLRQTVSPAILELESEGLINGFHHIIHKDIDLRLSCENWQQYENRIKEILGNHAISTDLKNWGMSPDRYGGETGVLLCYNNLELNSRLTLALIELIHETADEAVKNAQRNLCPHQWVHYLCNQSGFLNPEQIVFELNDAFLWLQTLIERNPGNSQVISFARNTLARFKQAANQFESSLGT